MEDGFGAVLRRIRKQAGKALGDLAQHLTVSLTYLSDVERGKRPPLNNERIYKAAIFLGVDPQPLIEAAAINQGAFTLPVAGLSAKGLAAGASLQRGWTEFGDDFFEEILRRLDAKKETP